MELQLLEKKTHCKTCSLRFRAQTLTFWKINGYCWLIHTTTKKRVIRQSSPRPSHFAVVLDCLCDSLFMKCCAVFTSDVTKFNSHQSKEYFSSSRGDHQDVFGVHELGYCVLFRELWFHLWTLPQMHWWLLTKSKNASVWLELSKWGLMRTPISKCV